MKSAQLLLNPPPPTKMNFWSVVIKQHTSTIADFEGVEFSQNYNYLLIKEKKAMKTLSVGSRFRPQHLPHSYLGDTTESRINFTTELKKTWLFLHM